MRKITNIHQLIQLVAGVALFSVAHASLEAQDSASVSRNVCYRGRPQPACDLFFLTDLSLLRRLYRPAATAVLPSIDSTQRTVRYRPAASAMSLELGAMKNLGKQHASGISFIFEVDRNAPDIGAKLRYRHWRSDGTAWDAGAGLVSRRTLTLELPLVDGYSREPHVRRLYFTGDVAYNIRDYAGVVSRLDIGTFNSRTRPTVSVGVRLSSRPGAVGTGAIALTYATLRALSAVILGADADW